MPCDATRFITNSAGFRAQNMPPKLRQAILCAALGAGNGYIGASGAGSAITTARNLLGAADPDLLAAARAQTWLEVCNANLGASLSTNMNTLAALPFVTILNALDPATLNQVEVFLLCNLIGAKMNG
jgi:hypothetical protein